MVWGKRNLSLIPLGAGGNWHTQSPRGWAVPSLHRHWVGCPLGGAGGCNFLVICRQDGSWPEKDTGVSCQLPVSTKAGQRQGKGWGP